MKSSKKVLSSWEKEEKVAKALAVVSVIGLAVFVISGLSWLLISKENFLDTIAICGFIVFILPVLILQVAMNANIGQYGISAMGFSGSIFFYLFLFPVIDAWFLCALNGLFHFLPDFRLIADITMRNEYRHLSDNLTFELLGIIYVSLTVIGLIIRLIRKIRNKS